MYIFLLAENTLLVKNTKYKTFEKLKKCKEKTIKDLFSRFEAMP